MRDLIERGGFVSPIHRAAVMDAHDDLVAGPRETAGEQNGIGRCTVHSGGREQPQRASDATADAMRAGLRSYVVMDSAAADAVMLAARAYVGAVWDQALVLAVEDGPVSLVAAESWVEGDAEYRARLRGIDPSIGLWFLPSEYFEAAQGEVLDRYGARAGLPRARLVLAGPRP